MDLSLIILILVHYLGGLVCNFLAIYLLMNLLNLSRKLRVEFDPLNCVNQKRQSVKRIKGGIVTEFLRVYHEQLVKSY